MRGYCCPGQSERNLKAELYRCPGCSHQVEIFSDELRARCLHCGKEVYRKKTPSCIDWCRAAEQCLGSEDVEAIKGEKGMKKSSLRKEVRREGIFLPFNETIFILFMSESIYLMRGLN